MDVNQVHIDAVLTNLAIDFVTPGFVAQRVMPFVPVKKESDKYFKFVAREELQSEREKSLRAPGAEAHEIHWSGTTDVYSCEEYAFSHMLPDRVRDNSDTPVRPRARVTRKITGKLWLGFEERVQALTQDTGALPGAAVTNKWNVALGDPELDIDLGKDEVRKQLGAYPNHILLSAPAARALRRKLKEKTTALGLQEEINFSELPKMVFGLQTIVAESVHNTAHVGQPTLTIADVWDDTVCLIHIDPDPGIDSFTFGVTFLQQNFLMKSWREERRKGEMQEGSIIMAEKRILTEAIYQLEDVL